jgi:hypothetical protein
LLSHPYALASKFIQFNVPDAKPEIKGLSWRYLQIGTESFWLEYTSTEDWRSNCGEGDINMFFRDKTELFPDKSYKKMPKYPLFAIDFVPDGDVIYAIDFNIAPGISGTGVDKLMSSIEIVESIKKAYFKLKDHAD